MAAVAVIYLLALVVRPHTTHLASAYRLGLPRHVDADGVWYLDLTKSIAEKGSLHVYENISALKEEAAREGGKLFYSLGRDGRVYSAFPPGISLLAAPFYRIGGIPGVYILNAVLGVLTVYFIYKCTSLYVSHENAVKTATAFAFGTAVFTYSQVFYAEALSCFLISSSFHYLNSWLKNRGWKSITAAGLMAGALPITKPSLTLVCVAFTLTLVLKRDWKGLTLFIISTTPFATAFMAYNTMAYGSPFETSYSNRITIDGSTDVRYYDSTDKSRWSNNPLKSLTIRTILIILTQPIMLVSFTGVVKNRWHTEIKIAYATTLLVLTVYSFNINPIGLWCWSDRYFTPLIPFMAVPFAYTVEKKQLNRHLVWTLTYLSTYLTIISLNPASWHLFSQSKPAKWISVKAR
jgi:hypothetical protein